jgi:hypothetical protein
MLEARSICIVIWPKVCTSKEQFGIQIHQNLVKVKKVYQFCTKDT